jgi:hypothetical protein
MAGRVTHPNEGPFWNRTAAKQSAPKSWGSRVGNPSDRTGRIDCPMLSKSLTINDKDSPPLGTIESIT